MTSAFDLNEDDIFVCFDSSPVTERRKEVWLNLNDSTKCGNVNFEFWEAGGLKLEKKKGFCLRWRNFFCACLYISCVCPIALFLHLKTRPEPPNPHPFSQGATCYLCIQDAMLPTRNTSNQTNSIPLSVPGTHQHICTPETSWLLIHHLQGWWHII